MAESCSISHATSVGLARSSCPPAYTCVGTWKFVRLYWGGVDYKRSIKIKNQCVFTYVVVVSHVRFGGPVVVHLKRSISDSLAERVGVKKKKMKQRTRLCKVVHILYRRSRGSVTKVYRNARLREKATFI